MTAERPAALAELPIDILEIDKRFIDNLTRDHEGRGFVNAIMQLAQTLHLETIAKGFRKRSRSRMRGPTSSLAYT